MPESAANSMEQRDPETPFPTSGRLLGLDYGTKRIGIAVSDQDQKIAGPLENYSSRGESADARHLAALVGEYLIQGIVVGLPVHMSGEEGEKAREARRFGKWVEQTTHRPVRYWDERFSSSRAEQHLMEAGLSKKKRKARTDKLAAQMILQAYLDADDRDRAPASYRTPDD